MLNRRHFIVTGAALFSQPIAAQTLSDPAIDTLTQDPVTADLPEFADLPTAAASIPARDVADLGPARHTCQLRSDDVEPLGVSPAFPANAGAGQ